MAAIILCMLWKLRIRGANKGGFEICRENILVLLRMSKFFVSISPLDDFIYDAVGGSVAWPSTTALPAKDVVSTMQTLKL